MGQWDASSGGPDVEAFRAEFETMLGEVLNHPCHVTVEDVDRETGVVELQADPDAAELRARLHEQGDPGDVDVAIDEGFTFRLSLDAEGRDVVV